MPRESARRGRREVPSAVESVRLRIEQWRATREKRTRMPVDLWDAATAVAREHGLWFVSRILRVNYECLKRRVGPSLGSGNVASFVEVPANEWATPSASAATVVELSSRDGARLTVRLEGHASLDVAALATAFWQREQ